MFDNTFYDRHGDKWWSVTDSPFGIIRYMMNPYASHTSSSTWSLESESFDMVFCLDVLEHVRNFRDIKHEVNRVLKSGGLFFFETVNRTLMSYLVVILVLQDFPWTSLIPHGVHDWKYFIRLAEFRNSLEENASTCGICGGYSRVGTACASIQVPRIPVQGALLH